MIPLTPIENDLQSAESDLSGRDGGAVWKLTTVGAYEYWEPILNVKAGSFSYSPEPQHSLPIWARETALSLGSRVPFLDRITSDILPPIPEPPFVGTRGRALVIPGVYDQAVFFQTFTFSSWPSNPFHPDKPLVVVNGGQGAARVLQQGRFAADLGDMFNPATAFRRGINNILDPVGTLEDIFTGKTPVVWISLPFGEGFIAIPIPNPFYFFFGQETDIEKQKESVKQLLGPVWRSLAEQGYEQLDNKEPKNLNSDEVSDILCQHPEHAALVPEMYQDADKIIDLAIGENKFSDGFRQRLIYQFLANCSRAGLTAEQTAQAWRALARSASPLSTRDWRRLGMNSPINPMIAGTPKPPCWQGPFPGEWQKETESAGQVMVIPSTQSVHPSGTQVKDIPPRQQPYDTPPGPQDETPPGEQDPYHVGGQKPIWWPSSQPWPPLVWPQPYPPLGTQTPKGWKPCSGPCKEEIDDLRRQLQERNNPVTELIRKPFYILPRQQDWA